MYDNKPTSKHPHSHFPFTIPLMIVTDLADCKSQKQKNEVSYHYAVSTYQFKEHWHKAPRTSAAAAPPPPLLCWIQSHLGKLSSHLLYLMTHLCHIIVLCLMWMSWITLSTWLPLDSLVMTELFSVEVTLLALALQRHHQVFQGFFWAVVIFLGPSFKFCNCSYSDGHLEHFIFPVEGDFKTVQPLS